MSYITVSCHLCQCNPNNPHMWYYNWFGFITLNDHKQRFSQPKLEIYGLYHAFSALWLFLIGVQNLVVKVNAHYIKGILNNLDIVPSASINCWILSILTFHFTLIHTPGSNHGPDGLLWHCPQPGNVPAEDDDFEDWIDQLYSFVHLINPTVPRLTTGQVLSIFASATTTAEPSDIHNTTLPEILYNKIPWTEQAKLDNLQLAKITQWLKNIKCPKNISDTNYAGFVQYVMDFFLIESQLWRMDAQGSHKLVVSQEQCIPIMQSSHNDLGHKGLYAMWSLIMECFWWPHIYLRYCTTKYPEQSRQNWTTFN